MRGLLPKIISKKSIILSLFLAISCTLINAQDTLSMQERMHKLDTASAIHFVLNNMVKDKIADFSKQKKLLAACLSNGQLYFPMMDEELAKNKLPLELKYITVLESHVNPNAGNGEGPTGLWQITNGTGKALGLRNDKYIDDRRNPLASTKAICAYFAKLYKMYGDWQLVITAYQVGNGTLDKIIARRGGKKDYWALRPYLPKYASEYMAKFFAVCYVLEYHETMGITPLEAKFNPAKLDTIQITQPIGFERMSKALNIEKSDISKLNPQYKQNFVPNENNLYVILPKEAAAVFREDPNKIYHFKLNK